MIEQEIKIRKALNVAYDDISDGTGLDSNTKLLLIVIIAVVVLLAFGLIYLKTRSDSNNASVTVKAEDA